MATKKVIDKFANIAAVSVTESAAGTATFTKFAFPFSIMDKMALLISRIEYSFGNIVQLNTSGDYIIAGLTVSNTLTDLSTQSDSQIIDSSKLLRQDIGTAASGQLYSLPVIKDFANLPGGGLLVAPNPLYAGIISSGAGGVTVAWLRMYYTYLELDTDEYWQLVESRRVISS